MKRLFFLLAFGILCLTGLAQNAQNTKKHKLTVTIKNFPDTGSLLLGNYFGDKTYITDTAVFDKKTKSYIIADTGLLYRGIYFLVYNQAKLVEFSITENQDFSISFDYKDPLNTLAFKNSLENTTFTDFQRQRSKQYAHMDELYKKLQKCDSIPNCDTASINKELRELHTSLNNSNLDFVKTYPNFLMTKVFLATKEIEIPSVPKELTSETDINDFKYKYYKAHFFDNIDLNEDGLIRSPVFQEKVDFYFSKMIHPSPDSVCKEVDMFLKKVEKAPELFKFSLWFLCNKYERSDRITDEAVFVHIVKNYYMKGKAPWTGQSTVKALEKRALQLEPVLIGKKAPNLIIPDSNENFVSMYDLKNKYTILVFWATDCGHCKTEIPKLKKFYDENHKLYDIEVYCVDTHNNKDDWKRLIKSMELNWINVFGMTANINWKEVYDVYSTPVIYVLDKNKEILLKRISTETIEDYFSKVVKKEMQK